jgi:hypothetical protein
MRGPRHEVHRDGAPKGQHLEVERIDGAGQVAHGREARLEHQPSVLRRVEREELGPGAHLGPDRVRLVGIDHADQVDVEVHESRHDRAAAGVEPRSGPVPELGGRRHALYAPIPDHERHVASRAGPRPIPEAVGHQEEFARHRALPRRIVVSSVFHRS